METESYLKECSYALKQRQEIKILKNYSPIAAERLPDEIGVVLPNPVIPKNLTSEDNILYPYSYNGNTTHFKIYIPELNIYRVIKIADEQKGVCPEANLLLDAKYAVIFRTPETFIPAYSDYLSTYLTHPVAAIGGFPFCNYKKPLVFVVHSHIMADIDEIKWLLDYIKYPSNDLYVYTINNEDENEIRNLFNQAFSNIQLLPFMSVHEWLIKSLNRLIRKGRTKELNLLFGTEQYERTDVEDFIVEKLWTPAAMKIRKCINDGSSYILGNGTEIKSENFVTHSTTLKGTNNLIANFEIDVDYVIQDPGGNRTFKTTIKTENEVIDIYFKHNDLISFNNIIKKLSLISSNHINKPYLTMYNTVNWLDVFNCMSSGKKVLFHSDKTGIFRDKIVLPGLTITSDDVTTNTLKGNSCQGFVSAYNEANKELMKDVLKVVGKNSRFLTLLIGVFYFAYMLKRKKAGYEYTKNLVFVNQARVLESLHYIFNGVKVLPNEKQSDDFVSIFNCRKLMPDMQGFNFYNLSDVNAFLTEDSMFLFNPTQYLKVEPEYVENMMKVVPFIIQRVVFHAPDNYLTDDDVLFKLFKHLVGSYVSHPPQKFRSILVDDYKLIPRRKDFEMLLKHFGTKTKEHSGLVFIPKCLRWASHKEVDRALRYSLKKETENYWIVKKWRH